ncbi:MAG: hypothetical protein E6G17_06810 [Actinobacteria bacterium]|nr:MAG: hypothetical protein E6G17_06810 [Actinomycetota bacterium]
MLAAAAVPARPSGDVGDDGCHPRSLLRGRRLLPGHQSHGPRYLSHAPARLRRARGRRPARPAPAPLDGGRGHAHRRVARGHSPPTRRRLHGRRPPRLGRGRLPFVRARTARARARRRPCALFDAARGVDGSGHRGTRRADAARPALVRGALARRAPGPAVGAATARRPASRASDGPGTRSGVVVDRDHRRRAARAGRGKPCLVSGDLQLVLLGEARYTALELFARADIDPELVRRFWRALGYTDVPDDDRIFTDADLRALETMARFMQSGVSDEVTVQQARVYGSSLARIAA